MSSRIARYKTLTFCLLLSWGKPSGFNQQLFFQVNLENSNRALLELQENHRVAISTLKEKEFIISKLLHSGKWELIIIYWTLYLLSYTEDPVKFLLINRKFFDWTCKGVAQWFAKCIGGHNFAVWKDRYRSLLLLIIGAWRWNDCNDLNLKRPGYIRFLKKCLKFEFKDCFLQETGW